MNRNLESRIHRICDCYPVCNRPESYYIQPAPPASEEGGWAFFFHILAVVLILFVLGGF